jgi:NAD(P)-dependent dehydrogenase (short-subunit alcohol dehydrogenase family)
MPRVFITGSTDGLGRAAARALIGEGHEVVLHSRSRERASAVDDLASRSAGVVVGDLASAIETRRIADQVNAIGRMDAVIHNAGAYATSGRSPTPEGHSTILAVNTLAPYVLSAMIPRRRSAAGTGTIASRSARRGKSQILGFRTSSRPDSPN